MDAGKLALGDLLILLSVIGATENNSNPAEFAAAVGIRRDGLSEIHKLRRLIHHSVAPLLSQRDDESSTILTRKISPPSGAQCRLLAELFAAGFGDHVAFYSGEEDLYKIGTEEKAQIHPDSVLAKKRCPIVMFQERFKNQKGNLYLKGCWVIDTEQIVRMASPYCRFSRVKSVPPKYDESTGKIIALYDARYIKVNEDLGQHWRTLEDDNETMLRFLTHAMLSGKVIEKFKPFCDKWVSPPEGFCLNLVIFGGKLF